VSRPEALAQGPQEIPVNGPAASGRGTTVLAAASSTGKPIAATRATAGRAPAQPAPIMLAKADPEPRPAAARGEDRPLYQRVLGGVFGGGTEASKTPEPAASTAPPPPRSQASPLPPRRKSVSAAPGKDQPETPVPAAKPQASEARSRSAM
jgi:hypothetical protein